MNIDPLVIPARREGKLWVTPPGGHGVIVHAPTLRQLHTSAQAALTLLSEDPPPVHLAPTSPELDALADLHDRYQAALTTAVRSLHRTNASLTDIAQACGIRPAQARELLAHIRPEEPQP